MELLHDAMQYVLPVLITAAGGVLVARMGKSDDSGDDNADGTSDPSTASHWQQLVTQMEAWTDRRIGVLESKLAERDERIDEMKAEFASVERRVSSLESKYRAALTFIRTLLARHPDASGEVPAEIRHDL